MIQGASAPKTGNIVIPGIELLATNSIKYYEYGSNMHSISRLKTLLIDNLNKSAHVNIHTTKAPIFIGAISGDISEWTTTNVKYYGLREIFGYVTDYNHYAYSVGSFQIEADTDIFHLSVYPIFTSQGTYQSATYEGNSVGCGLIIF